MGNPDALALLASRLKRPLTFVDVGARWGVQWEVLDQLGRFVCFEPDREECDRLNAAGSPNTIYYPYALSDRDGEVEITLTREPACSSVYPPVRELYEFYPALEVITPVSTKTVPCRRLDSLSAEIGLERLDVLKVDTQGSELDILRGAASLLAECFLVDIEVEFNELYRGQNLFHEVDAFLRGQGFVLWRIPELVHYRARTVPGAITRLRVAFAPGEEVNLTAGNGQLFWGQAHYVSREFPLFSRTLVPAERAVPAAFVCAIYGYWDLALDILGKSDTEMPIEDLKASLEGQEHSPAAGDPVAPEGGREAEGKVLELQGALAARERELAEKNKKIALLLGSRSWRLTAPIRAVGRWVSSLKKHEI